MKNPDFLYVDTNSSKLKVDWKVLGVSMVKSGCPFYCGTLELVVFHKKLME